MAMVRARVAKAAGLAGLAGLLAAGFVGYLRPSFVVDLTNMVLAWCG
ncbi:conserved exported hypothetical protein [Cupriavidus taiwanensis]|nr:conserved exported hypothetical protein [Cupriavidus taiwanensis]SOY47213.1 conserved exported hypothetical protein [Cupriavidus taiwanensis]SOY82685.1 conserved exported hypothetical protein [Cupriavidus taiwanensis]SOZ55233.1 conserved exported hypothetical protein [Cupriavidus taiwanensis]SOZ78492.1 conserved exported hypothetical protein [Cupriavidus taiwanensis]